MYVFLRHTVEHRVEQHEENISFNVLTNMEVNVVIIFYKLSYRPVYVLSGLSGLIYSIFNVMPRKTA